MNNKLKAFQEEKIKYTEIIDKINLENEMTL